MHDLSALILRMGLGALLMGHGGQKLFGWFRGPGISDTSQHLESLGLRPGAMWATLAGVSELAGGALTVLGLAHPLGPLSILGVMTMATRKAHAGRPIWGPEGGPELPITNSVIALSLLASGPGMFSLDRVFGTRVAPTSATILVLAGIGALALGLRATPTATAKTA
jgi:putative oxidoreductase